MTKLTKNCGLASGMNSEIVGFFTTNPIVAKANTILRLILFPNVEK
jgi:hypothetical protein